MTYVPDGVFDVRREGGLGFACPCGHKCAPEILGGVNRRLSLLLIKSSTCAVHMIRDESLGMGNARSIGL